MNVVSVCQLESEGCELATTYVPLGGLLHGSIMVCMHVKPPVNAPAQFAAGFTMQP